MNLSAQDSSTIDALKARLKGYLQKGVGRKLLPSQERANHESSRTRWRIMFITLLLVCFFATRQGVTAESPPGSVDFFPGDFLEYWASARLLLDGRNPYSPEQQLALQRTIVSNTEQPLMMWNPPWALSFILPFGLLSFSVAYILWLTVILACLLVCS